MSFFDNLLKVRKLNECPMPLWKLKVTDKEYEDLKGILQQHTRKYRSYSSVRKEATLFFAEFWRREYFVGVHSKEMVFSAISDNPDDSLINAFYDAAKKGADMLGIERYREGREQYLNSMLYQGGLPMKLVTVSDINSVWGRFVKGLVFRNINFDELDLGTVASTNKGLRQYCSQLCDAVDSKDFTRMPFWCKTEQNRWYQFLLNKFTSIRLSHRLINPFTLDWEFTFDKVHCLLHIKYDFKGLQSLPKVFCEENHLQIEKFLSLNITRNGQIVDSFDYLNGFCRHEVHSKHPYNNGDIIAAYFEGIDNPLKKESLDLTTPHILTIGENERYKLCSRIGRDESVILVPEGWNLVSPVEGLSITDIRWIDMPFKCIWLPEDFDSEVILSGDDGDITFCTNTDLSWTKVSSLPLTLSNVVEPLYNASQISCVICTAAEDVPVKKRSHGIEFRNKWSNTWTNTPSYGEIFVRAISGNGDYITHEKIVNVGDRLAITTINADKTHCQIKIDWPYGKVQGPEGSTVDDCVWNIKRDPDSGVDRNHIEFTFTPFHNEMNRFSLHVKAPFKDFSISDGDGQRLQNGCMIPFSDIDRYRYYIVGIDVEKLKIGDAEYRIKWIENQLYFISSDNRDNIPYEGSLTRILGGRENLQLMLERTSKDMLHATVPFTIVLTDGRKFSFTVKEAPYQIRQSDDNTICVTENGLKPIRYNHALKLLKLDDPSVAPVPIKPNENGYFSLPIEVRDWGNTLVIGQDRGRICPALVNTDKVLSPEDRRTNRAETIERIHKELNNATIGSTVWKRIIGWYENSNTEDIPSNSLLDIVCLRDSPDYLLKFALVKFAETPEEDRYNLDDRLLEMGKDLAFQWHWLLPKINNGLAELFQTFITEESWTSDVVTKLFVIRISHKYPNNNLIMSHLENLADRNEAFKTTLLNECLVPLLDEFHSWLISLSEKSMKRPFKNMIIDENSEAIISDIINRRRLRQINDANQNENLISLNQGLDKDTQSFFDKYEVSGNKSSNEIWLSQRVKCVADQIRGNLDLFCQSEAIRRSIIFCYRSTTRQFLLELNNELA